LFCMASAARAAQQLQGEVRRLQLQSG
jgi:hypothetical protein